MTSYEGSLRKLRVEQGDDIQYHLPIGDDYVFLNSLIGQTGSIQFQQKILCIGCGRVTRKSFFQGYCYPCFQSSPETSPCIIRPELCRAHEGIGLGDKFLRHIERCNNILHLIDISNDNLLENYSNVRKELSKYSNKLTKKNEIIVFNKIDMMNEEQIKKKIDVFKKRIKKKIYLISALRQRGLINIKKILINYEN